METLNKIQGALIGGAIGDAVGFLVEKNPITVIRSFADDFANENFIIKQRTYPQTFEFGQYSDDTQFSKLLALSFLDKKSFKDLLSENYIKGNLVGLGKNTTKLLKLYSKNKEVDPKLVQNISNGSLMRSWPVGLLFSCPLSIKVESQNHSSLTHNTTESIESCEFVAKITNYILNTNNFNQEDVISMAPAILKDLLISALNTQSPEELRELLISPSLADWEGVPPLAIPTAIASVVSFLKTIDQDFKSSIKFALLLGGDTDSVCSILGALKGAHIGIDKINPFLRNIVHDNGNFKEDFFLDLALRIKKFRENK